MKRLIFTATVVLVLLVVLAPLAQASPSSDRMPQIFGVDCKDAPTPEAPGSGIAAFFSKTPDKLPPPGDPFAAGSETTIYEQYGYAGLSWSTYDLGCGPDAARNPQAVVGTAVANWLIQAPISLTALVGSLTEVAFNPTFLGAFDPVIANVSHALHRGLFETWLPAVLALLGGAIIFRARRAHLASTASAIGWSLLVILLATALFRWPIQAGRLADNTVTSTLGATVSQFDGHGPNVDPGTAVSSNVVSSIFYRSWLAGTLGNSDSRTAKKYGPRLFKAHALTWREAALLERNPERGKSVIEAKQIEWKAVASEIKSADPQAYEYLTGKKSETRVGYAVLSTVAAFLALPFLSISALLLLGCFLIVRLAVMMFPAFATLGAFPAARGLVIGLGRTVGAAVINAILFGVGAGVMVSVLGLLFNPGRGTPSWLGLVLMPLFSFIMWVALRPFRRLTHMVRPHDDHFASIASAAGDTGRAGGSLLKKAGVVAFGAYTGNVAAAATMTALDDDDAAPRRAEAEPHVEPSTATEPRAPEMTSGLPSHERPPTAASGDTALPKVDGSTRTAAPMIEGFIPRPTSEPAPPPPTEPEWVDGEEIYTIYRPDEDDRDDDAS